MWFHFKSPQNLPTQTTRRRFFSRTFLLSSPGFGRRKSRHPVNSTIRPGFSFGGQGKCSRAKGATAPPTILQPGRGEVSRVFGFFFSFSRVLYFICFSRGRVVFLYFILSRFFSFVFSFERLFKEKIRTHLDLLSIPQSGRKDVKTFRWDQRLQVQNHFMAFKRVPRWKQHWVNSMISGRSPPLYCTFTLIAMQGHQKNIKNKTETT